MMEKVGRKALPRGGLCEAEYEATSLHLRHLPGICADYSACGI